MMTSSKSNSRMRTLRDPRPGHVNLQEEPEDEPNPFLVPLPLDHEYIGRRQGSFLLDDVESMFRSSQDMDLVDTHNHVHDEQLDFLLDHPYYRHSPNDQSLQELLESTITKDHGPLDPHPFLHGLAPGTVLETQEIIPYEQHVLNMLDQDLDSWILDQGPPTPQNTIEMELEEQEDDDDNRSPPSPQNSDIQEAALEKDTSTSLPPKKLRKYYKRKPKPRSLEQGLEFLEFKIQRLQDRTGATAQFSVERLPDEQLQEPESTVTEVVAVSPGATTLSPDTGDDHSYAAVILTQRSESPSVHDHQYNEVSTTTGLLTPPALDLEVVEREPNQNLKSGSGAGAAHSPYYYSRQYERDKCFGQGISAIFKKILQLESNFQEIQLKFHLEVQYEETKFNRSNYASAREILSRKRLISRKSVKRFHHLDLELDPPNSNSSVGIETFLVRKKSRSKSNNAKITVSQAQEHQHPQLELENEQVWKVSVQIPGPTKYCTICNDNSPRTDQLLDCSSTQSPCPNSVHLACLGFKVTGELGPSQIAQFPPYFCPDHR